MDKNLDRTRVNDSLFSIETLCDGILCYDSLSGTRMGRHQYTFVALYRIHRHALEGIQFELVLAIGFGWWNVLRYRDIVVARRYGYLVSDLTKVTGEGFQGEETYLMLEFETRSSFGCPC